MTRNLAASRRYAELKAMLEERRRELMSNMHNRIRHVRADGTTDRDVLDDGESCEVEIQNDLELVLIQMTAETLAKVNEALCRLNEGAYGHCVECGEEIAEARLRALPFAIRCKNCEDAHETVKQHRVVAPRHACVGEFSTIRCATACRVGVAKAPPVTALRP